MELKHHKIRHAWKQRLLLIVPYGIETANGFFHLLRLVLLIVPYGIETENKKS